MFLNRDYTSIQETRNSRHSVCGMLAEVFTEDALWVQSVLTSAFSQDTGNARIIRQWWTLATMTANCKRTIQELNFYERRGNSLSCARTERLLFVLRGSRYWRRRRPRVSGLGSSRLVVGWLQIHNSLHQMLGVYFTVRIRDRIRAVVMVRARIRSTLRIEARFRIFGSFLWKGLGYRVAAQAIRDCLEWRWPVNKHDGKYDTFFFLWYFLITKPQSSWHVSAFS